MQKQLSKNLLLFVLGVGTIAILIYIVQNLGNDRLAAPQKKFVKKIQSTDPSPRGLVKEALLPKQTELEFCYENFLKTKPEVAEGTVTLRWLIDADGTVLSAQLEKSDLENEVLTGCILEKLNGLSFSPPPGLRKTEVSYKLKFRPETQAALNFSE